MAKGEARTAAASETQPRRRWRALAATVAVVATAGLAAVTVRNADAPDTVWLVRRTGPLEAWDVPFELETAGGESVLDQGEGGALVRRNGWTDRAIDAWRSLIGAGPRPGRPDCVFLVTKRTRTEGGREWVEAAADVSIDPSVWSVRQFVTRMNAWERATGRPVPASGPDGCRLGAKRYEVGR